MKKKAMLSQPMAGRTEQEIIAARDHAIAELERRGYRLFGVYTSRLIGLYRAAEVTVDFGRAGSVARLLNAWCPYFNPAVQGVAKVFRSAVKMKDGKVCGVNLKTLTGSREEEILAALSNQRYGYSALIQSLSKEARSMPDGEEKAEIKGQIVLLARLANDFYERCMTGEISDPVRYIKYHRFGSVVCDELVRLGEAESGYDPESFNFDPTFSCPAYLRDPSNSDKQYTLSGNEELREQFIALQEENYGKAVEKLVLSSEYQKLSKSAQAAALEQQRSIVLAETKEEFLKYSFQPPTNKPKSYVDPKNRSKEYVLTEEQQMAYVRLSREVYNDAVLTIITDPSYAQLTDAQKAERLNAMRSSLAAEVKDRFLLWLSQNTTSTDREADKVSKETKRYVKALLGW